MSSAGWLSSSRRLGLTPTTLIVVIAACAWAAAGGPQPARAQEVSLEQQILRASAGWFEALARGDAEEVGRLQTDDYLTIQQTPAGVALVNKAQQLASLQKAPPDRPRFARSMTNVRVRQYGDVAILTALASFESVGGEKPIRSRAVATEVWVKVDGQWRLAHFQPTDIGGQAR